MIEQFQKKREAIFEKKLNENNNLRTLAEPSEAKTALELTKAEIQKLVSIDVQAIAAVRDSYIALFDGRANIAPVGYLAFPRANGDCHIKYGYFDKDPIFVVKIATGFYNNPNKNLPVVHGLVLIFSVETGELIALLHDGGWLTDLRTAIGAAIATFALCRENAKEFSIVGTGVQARFCAQALDALAPHPIKINLWGRTYEKAKRLAQDLAHLGMEIDAERDLETLCRKSDVIITATPTTRPLVLSDWIKPGCHITAVGADAPDKQELETSLVTRADIRVVDSLEQCFDRGEFARAFKEGLIGQNDCILLGALLADKVAGRRSEQEVSIVDLTGVAAQDIAIARTVLERVSELE